MNCFRMCEEDEKKVGDQCSCNAMQCNPIGSNSFPDLDHLRTFFPYASVAGSEHKKPSATMDIISQLISRIMLIHFVLLISRQGKVRLTKWYSPYSQKERTKVIRELSGLILTRGPKLCNFVEWRGYKVVYKRYASLYFCMCIDQDQNELEVLEIIHHYVEILDRYFGSVCELDLIFHFHKV
ncbi:hypothetical protein ACS0TY_013722 [Phlomoides rotata]